jgi:hypothetical protein
MIWTTSSFFDFQIPPPNHIPGEDVEPYLHLIEPGGIGGNEMQGKSPAALRPLHHLCMLMKAEIVGDDMKKLVGIEPVEVLEEVEERGVVVPVNTSPCHFSAVYGESCQKTGGAVPLVSDGLSFRVTGS